MRYIKLFILIYLSSITYANELKVYNLDIHDHFQIGEGVDYIELEKGSSIEDALSARAWSKNENNSFKLRNVHSTIWIQLAVQISVEGSYFISAETPNLNLLEVYIDSQLAGNSGDEIVGSKRKIKDAYPTIGIQIPKGYSVIFIKLAMDEDFIIPLTIRSEQSYQKSFSNRQLLMGIYMGVMASILLYNFFLFLSIRNKLLIYYCFYVLLVALTQLSIFSNLSMILYPESSFLLTRDVYLTSAVLGIAIGPFVLNFLNLKENSRLWYYFILGIVLLYPFCTVWALSTYYVESMTALIFINMLGSTALLVCAIVIYKREPLAKYFLLAWSVFLIGVIVYILQHLGIVQYHSYITGMMTSGTALEAVLLSLALGYHFNRLIKDNLAKEEVITEQEQLIKELDHKVITAELIQLRSQMNPHFLFNALTSIQNFILKNDKIKAVEYVGEYAKIVREQLDQASVAHISIKNEIGNLDKYLRIERLRYPLQFAFSFEVDSAIESETTFIPPLFLQPLLENCVKHAFTQNFDAGAILVEFKVVEDPNIVLVKVNDNGKGKQAVNTSEHRSKGMMIIQERLERLSKLHQNESIRMVTKGHSAEGYEVQLYLPKL